MPIPNNHLHPSEYDYAITPSQLDAFQAFLDAEYDWAQWWGNSEEPVKSAEEYAAECEKKLIDQINRCPKEPIEAADKGTVVNEIVDCLIHGRTPQNGIALRSIELGKARFIIGSLNGFIWLFDISFLSQLAARFTNAISQYPCGAPLQTSKGLVWLYGYLDEWVAYKISDIKTTGEYHFGKYERKWQKHVYPYAVVESGDCAEIQEFEYTAVKLSKPTEKDPIIHGEIYPEVYTNDHEQNRRMLQGICEQFIEWLECRREFITDRRIFGDENPEGYVGVPVDINKLINK